MQESEVKAGERCLRILMNVQRSMMWRLFSFWKDESGKKSRRDGLYTSRSTRLYATAHMYRTLIKKKHVLGMKRSGWLSTCAETPRRVEGKGREARYCTFFIIEK